MNTETEKTAKSAEQAADENSLLSIVNQAESVNETQAPGSATAAQSEPVKPPPDPGSVAISAMAVGVMARGAEMFYPCLSFDNGTKQHGVEVLAPVLAKHNLKSEFFKKWEEEFAAGAFFGGLIFQSYVKIQAWKVEQAKEVKSDV